METNKLIAEFMDVKTITIDELTWDWLMPAIEEIEKIGYKLEKNYQPIDKDWQSLIVKGNDILYQQFNDDSLKSSYDVVVDFIEDYNKIK